MVYIKPTQQNTKELKFLRSFRNSTFFEKYTYNLDGNYIFLEEPYTGFGYPDMVLLTWNKKIKTAWNEKRNNLTINDIKIVQHLYNSDKEKSINNISLELGFSERQVFSILFNLHEAGIVKNRDNFWHLKELEDIFFLNSIITIEAKLKNWQSALLQAKNSDYFSSEVFTLFPENVLNENLLNSYSNTDIGVITYNQNYNIVKPANRKELPITLNGWLFNELIGRMLWPGN